MSGGTGLNIVSDPIGPGANWCFFFQMRALEVASSLQRWPHFPKRF